MPIEMNIICPSLKKVFLCQTIKSMDLIKNYNSSMDCEVIFAKKIILWQSKITMCELYRNLTSDSIKPSTLVPL